MSGPLNFAFDETQRGFGYLKALDLYGIPFSFQASSLATAEAIWLGSERALCPYFVRDCQACRAGTCPLGHLHDVPEDAHIALGARMHLDRDGARQLGEMLVRFAGQGDDFWAAERQRIEHPVKAPDGLAVWELDEGGEKTWFVAATEARFRTLVRDYYRESYAAELDDDLKSTNDCEEPCGWKRLDDDFILTMYAGDYEPGEILNGPLECKWWAKIKGEGFLCTTVY